MAPSPTATTAYTLCRRGDAEAVRWYLTAHALNRTSLVEFDGAERPAWDDVRNSIAMHIAQLQSPPGGDSAVEGD